MWSHATASSAKQSLYFLFVTCNDRGRSKDNKKKYFIFVCFLFLIFIYFFYKILYIVKELENKIKNKEHFVII